MATPEPVRNSKRRRQGMEHGPRYRDHARRRRVDRRSRGQSHPAIQDRRTYIREAFVSRKTKLLAGTTYHFSFSPDLKYVYIPDGSNKQVHILERESLKEVGAIGGCGGQMPGCFNHLHVAAVDSVGNVYTGEAAAGARIERWNISQ